MNPLYPAVRRRAGWRCEYCHAPEVLFNFPFEVEHIVPAARGGTDAADNLALACRSCNSHKGSRLTASDPDTGAEASMYHPREQGWADHFALDADTGTICGLTATGRATVDALRMNDPQQITARQIWITLRLFP